MPKGVSPPKTHRIQAAFVSADAVGRARRGQGDRARFGRWGTGRKGCAMAVSSSGLARPRSNAVNASMRSGASNARLPRPTVIWTRIPARTSWSIACVVARSERPTRSAATEEVGTGASGSVSMSRRSAESHRACRRGAARSTLPSGVACTARSDSTARLGDTVSGRRISLIRRLSAPSDSRKRASYSRPRRAMRSSTGSSRNGGLR